MGDYGDLRPFNRSGKVQDARLQGRHRFSSRRGEIEHIAGPGIDFRPINCIPPPSLPGTEVDFTQTRIDAGLWRQDFSQAPGAGQRAGKHGDTGRQLRPEPAGDKVRLKTIHIEPAITNARFDQRTRMTDQENLHSKPQ